MFQSALATARAYAKDWTTVAYCFRTDQERTAFLFAGLHDDIEMAVQGMRRHGASPRQVADVVEAVLTSAHPATPTDHDAALDALCAPGDVQTSYLMLIGIGSPLFARPPFREMRP